MRLSRAPVTLLLGLGSILPFCQPPRAAAQQQDEPPSATHETVPPSSSTHGPMAAVTLNTVEGARRWQLVLPYPLRDTLLLPKSGGGHRVILLLGEHREGGGGRDPASQVLSFDLETPTEIVPLTTPQQHRPVEITLAGDLKSGKVRPFALTATGVLALDLDGPERAREVLRHPPGSRPGFPEKGLSNTPGSSILPLVQAGSISLYRPTVDARLLPAGTHRLPVRAQRKSHSLRLDSPPVTLLDRPEGSPLLVIGPEAQGPRRLRTLLVDPSKPEDPEPTEAWSLLPATEEVASSWYAWVDGRPILLVTTYSADKVGVFEKQKLRVFSLRPDRTRRGSSPSLARLTASRRWQILDPVLADVDADGKQDLVVIQPEGLGGGKLILEAHSSLSLGRFRQTPRKTVIPVTGQVWSYGEDVNGDGIPDLAAVEENQVLIFLGNPDPRKRSFMERKARWSLPLSQGPKESEDVFVTVGTGDIDVDSSSVHSPNALRLADLDGDGRAEILVSRAGGEDRSLVEIFQLDL